MGVDGRPVADDSFNLLDLARHEFAICNACRYCEAYCAVFPAMERRSLFTDGDLTYLANLCHDCRACHQACMYTEPHEFAINIPKLLTEARVESYAHGARPRVLGRAFERGPVTLLAVNLACLAILLVLVAVFGTFSELSRGSSGAGAFYDVVSHLAMAVPALLLTAYGVTVVAAGVVSFWREAGGRTAELLSARLWITALREVGSLRWMRGGGAECYYPDEERPSRERRLLHHFTAYGFLATFLATVSAFVEEMIFGIHPPYPVVSTPVILGFLGGMGVIVGCVGLIRLKAASARHMTIASARAMDSAFLLSLLLVAGTGMALLVLRETELMHIVLIVHLATVAAFYLTAPYGKLVHGVYRFAAVLRSVQEQHDEAAAASPSLSVRVVTVAGSAQPVPQSGSQE